MTALSKTISWCFDFLTVFWAFLVFKRRNCYSLSTKQYTKQNCVIIYVCLVLFSLCDILANITHSNKLVVLFSLCDILANITHSNKLVLPMDESEVSINLCFGTPLE